jgi:hypothetical protein
MPNQIHEKFTITTASIARPDRLKCPAPEREKLAVNFEFRIPCRPRAFAHEISIRPNARIWDQRAHGIASAHVQEGIAMEIRIGLRGGGNKKLLSWQHSHHKAPNKFWAFAKKTLSGHLQMQKTFDLIQIWTRSPLLEKSSVIASKSQTDTVCDRHADPERFIPSDRFSMKTDHRSLKLMWLGDSLMQLWTKWLLLRMTSSPTIHGFYDIAACRPLIVPESAHLRLYPGFFSVGFVHFVPFEGDPEGYFVNISETAATLGANSYRAFV